MMKKIKLLENATINKIAAGEVIERPFSVIKELVENAIDADSTKIVIEIKEGGIPFIRVTDNGSGIAAKDLALAFQSHATSKINQIQDLNSLDTLGFRGEALASIAAVSQVELTTKTAAQDSARTIEVFGGEIIGEKEAAGTDGTSFLVRNLFYNTPARKKFLKSVSAETGYISDFINKIAISRPDISFRFINNGSEALFTSGNGDLKTAIFSVYGMDYAQKLLEVEGSYEFARVSGYIGRPEISRANRGFEDMFVNGRYVKDKIISKAAEDAYRTHLPGGRFPMFALDISIPPKEVDVNAHPQKLEIRFSREDVIYQAVYNAVDTALKNSNLVQGAVWGKPEKPEKPVVSPAPTMSEQKQGDSADFKYPQNNLQQSFRVKEEERFVLDRPIALGAGTDAENRAVFSEKDIFKKLEKGAVEQQALSTQTKKEPLFSNYRLIGQAFATYWLVEQAEKLYIIDQHAAHERILFEQFMKSFRAKAPVAQVLLSPERLRLSEREKGLLEEHRGYFEDLGFDVFQEDGVFYLRSVPVALSAPENQDMLKQLLDGLDAGTAAAASQADLYEVRLNRVATIACKAAVKANDRLSPLEAEAIIKALLNMENPFTCPHGRPTIIEMSKYELEKKFKRVNG